MFKYNVIIYSYKRIYIGIKFVTSKRVNMTNTNMKNTFTILLLVFGLGLSSGQQTNFKKSYTYSSNSLNRYSGVLPCADCKGIKTDLLINLNNQSFKITEEYLGKMDSKKFS